jgi:hypothetical protein
MRPLNSSELLSVWEKGNKRSPTDKALLLLDTACSDGEPADPALLSIGERDARLLQIREWMFGSHLLNVSHCPSCGEHIEWVTEISDLRFNSTDKISPGPYYLQTDAFTIQFRMPNSYDLTKLSSDRSYQSDPSKLLADCVLDVQHETGKYNTHELPEAVYDVLDQQMSMQDPQANISMALNCPVCTHTWELQFDIVHYLWTEVDNWAKHILQDVAILASNFGWSEAEILQMSPQRRQLYLEMIRK